MDKYELSKHDFEIIREAINDFHEKYRTKGLDVAKRANASTLLEKFQDAHTGWLEFE